MWYSRSIAEETVLDSWDAVARRLCGQWNVVAVDLKDKPSAASWGMGGDDDWDAAAARLGNHVLGKCPRWLIVVEGVGAGLGADQDPEMSFAAMCAAVRGSSAVAISAALPSATCSTTHSVPARRPASWPPPWTNFPNVPAAPTPLRT